MADIGNVILERVRERAVANVVQHYGRHGAFRLVVGYFGAFHPQRVNGKPHKRCRPNGVQKTRVLRSGVNHIAHSQLFDSAQTLKPRVLHQCQNQGRRKIDKPQHGVVDYLCFRCVFVHYKMFFRNRPNRKSDYLNSIPKIVISSKKSPSGPLCAFSALIMSSMSESIPLPLLIIRSIGSVPNA